jgi:CxxC motif-containing protein (DUF1111 family)
MEVRAFAAEQRFLRAFSIGVAIPEVVNVTRRARSLPVGGFPRSGSHRFPRKKFSAIGFSFCSHDLAVAEAAKMTKRQTKFGRRDVNDAENQTRDIACIQPRFGASSDSGTTVGAPYL